MYMIENMLLAKFKHSRIFLMLSLFNFCLGYDELFVPAPEFSKYSLIKPKMYHTIQKREISTSKESKNTLKHMDHISISIEIEGMDHILDLQLNRNLIPKTYFEKHQNDGSYVINRPSKEEMELCNYQGKVSGVPDSWAAISTCDGVRGMISMGKNVYHVETVKPDSKIGDTHVIYRNSDLVRNYTCGFNGHDDIFSSKKPSRKKREIRGPYNANKQSRYIELVLVIDNRVYKSFGENIRKVNQRAKEISNIINSLYMPLNIFVALVGVVIWSNYDEIKLEESGDNTLTNFLNYRRESLSKEHPNDNAQLLTRMQFDELVVGKALKGPICTFQFSGGVNTDHSTVVSLVATTIAHEMGHNLGMEHDSDKCKCPSERCIMAPSSSSKSPTDWSSCSLEYLAVAFDHGMDYCLRNKPESLFESPVCGNGFVEDGEECDCGLKERCSNICCDASTCKLNQSATCATGSCCDLQTCKPLAAGTQCRQADHECDLPEYCKGDSEYCPEDVFKIDGEECSVGKAFCYKGSCQSHSDQCKLLWGPSGKSSDSQCYKMNTKGTRHGNCGYIRINKTYIKCLDEDVFCGMLQCKHLNERLEFGMETVSILSHSFINSGGSIIPCRTAMVDLGTNEIDPGLAPDGSKCGDNKMCLNQKCIPVELLRELTMPRACPNNCHGNGICNNKGRCHCNDGYGPPDCEYPGFGGSEDSGPATNPLVGSGITHLSYFTLLGLVPVIIIILIYSYYARRSPFYMPKKLQRRSTYVNCCNWSNRLTSCWPIRRNNDWDGFINPKRNKITKQLENNTVDHTDLVEEDHVYEKLRFPNKLEVKDQIRIHDELKSNIHVGIDSRSKRNNQMGINGPLKCNNQIETDSQSIHINQIGINRQLKSNNRIETDSQSKNINQLEINRQLKSNNRTLTEPNHNYQMRIHSEPKINNIRPPKEVKNSTNGSGNISSLIKALENNLKL